MNQVGVIHSRRLFLQQILQSRRHLTLYDQSSTDLLFHSIKLDRDKQKQNQKQKQMQKQLPWRRKDLTGNSLIASTLEEMENDSEFQLSLQNLKQMGQKKLTLEEKKIRRRALDDLNVPPFKEFKEAGGDRRRRQCEVLQLNIGLYCNQACNHCHVESSPQRSEMMTRKVADECLKLLKNSKSITTLDITGGAPEMNSEFRYIVEKAREIRGSNLDIIDRCNLTVVHEPGQEDLILFLKKHNVHVIASLPCYSEKNVNTQRGTGVFNRSISALLAFNEAGFGVGGGAVGGGFRGYKLDLVYNPLGAFLPPPQDSLEAKYKEELMENFGIEFSNLFTMTNMPVKRFADFLHRRRELKDYMDLLVKNFNKNTVSELMCRNTVSVGWDGIIYDCDFNQQLGLGVGGGEEEDMFGGGNSKTVFEVGNLDELLEDEIAFDNHCYGCTAGMGSS